MKNISVEEAKTMSEKTMPEVDRIGDIDGETCDACIYCRKSTMSHPETGEMIVTGQCRKNPPSVTMVPVPTRIQGQMQLEQVVHFPIVDVRTGWCGELLTKEKLEEFEGEQ